MHSSIACGLNWRERRKTSARQRHQNPNAKLLTVFGRLLQTLVVKWAANEIVRAGSVAQLEQALRPKHFRGLSGG